MIKYVITNVLSTNVCKKVLYLSNNFKKFEQFSKSRMDMNLNKLKFDMFILHKNSIILNISTYLFLIRYLLKTYLLRHSRKKNY